MGARSRFAVVFAAAGIGLLLPAAAHAQQVTGLDVRQDDGFATLSWDPVAGATEYDVERTPAAATRAGRSRGGRLAPEPPDHRRRRRSRTPGSTRATGSSGGSALVGTEPQPYSEPVSGTTPPESGDPGTPGENLRTQWEEAKAATYTSDVNEYAYTAAIDAASKRVRVVEIGRTVLGRPINMFIIGYPAPRPTGRQSPATRRAAELQRARQRARRARDA